MTRPGRTPGGHRLHTGAAPPRFRARQEGPITPDSPRAGPDRRPTSVGAGPDGRPTGVGAGPDGRGGSRVELAEAYPAVDPVLLHAMSWAAEFGVRAVSPGTGAALRLLAAATRARSVVEIGTGTGVSGLWLLQGMPADARAHLDRRRAGAPGAGPAVLRGGRLRDRAGTG